MNADMKVRHKVCHHFSTKSNHVSDSKNTFQNAGPNETQITPIDIDKQGDQKPQEIMVRLKSRYLLMEMRFEDGMVDESINSSALYNEIMKSVENAYGDFGYGCIKMTFKVKYVNPYTGVVFVKCSRDYYRMLWHAITFVKKINGRQCSLTTLHLGGTIKSCQRYLLKYNKKQLSHLLVECKTKGEREKILKC
ncbi:ribonuclease P/MRP protein subunit POP5-like isoform X2 [Xenia sp. Carnegie-2017]|uniref:ribonuclease P/MRP protein subunit POP5-like isoform X2 n=1 Tax=Xenia sp. Carnegie-2017 TaxID=2897299 RepID=UPI001F04F81F|nr:ribonuclease P/MRP protein subunit POP5-like isoform X2 [Xenia sp. Carnegie-2017]